jgi:superfamily II DNA helicase RecQ
MSFCLLMTFSSDLSPLTFLINNSTKKKTLVKRKLYKLQQLKVYTKACDCRKRTLFKLLGEDFSVEDCKKTCDFCIDDMAKNTVYEEIDYS